MLDAGPTAYDPPCWGEVGLPLLPSAWRHRIPSLPLDLQRRTKGTRGRPRKEAEATTPPTTRLLTTAADWSRYKWDQPPTSLAVDVFELILQDEPLPHWIDLPVLTGHLQRPDDVAQIPFLVSTWEVLTDRIGGPRDVARALGSTALELLTITNCSMTVLDVAITAPSWTNLDSVTGSLTVHQPSRPDHTAAMFTTAAGRHLRAACVDPKHLDPEVPWFTAISGRAGIHPAGRLTLEEAGDLIGVTRERVRQVTRDLELEHSVRRRWPLPGPLQSLRAELIATTGNAVEEVEERLNQNHGWLGHGGFKRAIEILDWYGHAPGLSVGPLGMIGPSAQHLRLPEGLTLASIPNLVWKLSNGTGFLLETDLRAELRSRYHDLTPDVLDQVLEVVIPPLRLPLGYLFHTRHSDGAVYGVLSRMTAWIDHLTIVDFHGGLSRRFKFRKFPMPPPPMVLEALIRKLPDFDVVDDQVVPHARGAIDTTTIMGWIGAQLRESPAGVLHRSVLLESARLAGLNPTSVGLYISYGSIVQALGQNCFALVGTNPSAIDIENARRDANLLRIPDRVSTSYGHAEIRLAVTVGSSMRDSGLISLPVRACRMIGGVRLAVTSELGQNGTSIISGSLLTGFSSAFNALGVMTGDDLEIRIDLTTNTIHIRPDDEPEPAGAVHED